jgi:NADH dehydrogenase
MNRMRKPKVVIVGAGFAGLWAARSLARQWADVLLVDRNNYHTFLALLYQVAAAELEPEDIAYPVRSIFWGCPNVAFALADVKKIDLEKKSILTDGKPIPYDCLILAAGSITHTFGVPGAESHAYYLKTLEEAVTLKNHIICCFEKAARDPDIGRRTGVLTFVIVGGGATGVEYAGALSELVHGPLARDYGAIDFRTVRIVLLEAADRLVAHMPGTVSSYTARRLAKMGVEVRLDAKVLEVTPGGVRLQDGSEIPSRTVVWTAGVRGEPLAALSGLPTGRDGRVPVLPTLQAPGHPEIYVVGDLASIRDRERPLPMVAQVAIQSAVAAAGNIVRHIKGEPLQPFVYRDRGMMIAIGRNAAGAAIGSRTYTGLFAWIIWLLVHLLNLIGFRNRIMVLINWAWDYLLYERAVRFVFPAEMPSGVKSSACASDIGSMADRPEGRYNSCPAPHVGSAVSGQTSTGAAVSCPSKRNADSDFSAGRTKSDRD